MLEQAAGKVVESSLEIIKTCLHAFLRELLCGAGLDDV